MTESWFRREFLTFRRLAFNFFFYGSHILVFAYGWQSQQNNTRLAGLNTLGVSVWTSRGAGLVLAYLAFMILLPLLRNVVRMIRPKLAWLMPFDENLWFHRQVAYSLAFWSAVHTTAHYVNFINVERRQIRPELAVQIHYTQPGGITGHFMLLIMVIMFTTAHKKIRKQCFEAFWYTHHLAFFFMLALYVHATGCFVRDSPHPDLKSSFPFYSTQHCLGYESWRYTVWPGLAYFGERLWREIRARKFTRLDKVLVHPSGAIELRMFKPSFKYTPGQWVFLQVPAVSQYQWHPFSITSAPEDPYVSVTICPVGDWTYALSEAVGAGPAVVAALGAPSDKHDAADQFYEVVDRSRTLPIVRIDGPYGAPSEDVFNCDLAVLVGAGIGVTPFASILKHIWYRQQAGRLHRLRRVEFIWICRDAASFSWYMSVLRDIEAAQIDTNFLRIHMYTTQRVDIDELYNIAINDISTGGAYDPLTRLRTTTHYGRPDFKAIYSRLRSAIELGAFVGPREVGTMSTVGTFFCGPSSLAKVVREHALSSSTPSAHFTFAKEHF